MTFTALAGCGGGGGGSAGPPTPTLSVSPTSISASGSINSLDQPSANLVLTITNPPGGLYVGLSSTNNGVEGVGVASQTSQVVELTVDFKPARSLKPATYSDTITVAVCVTAACSSTYAATSHVIPVTYTVTAPAGNAAPQVLLTPAAVSYHQVLIPNRAAPDPWDPPSAPIGISFVNFGATPTVSVTSSAIGITAANYLAQDATHATITPSFRLAQALGVGSFQDSVTLSVCLDPDCVNPASGSPFTIPISYTIDESTTVAGTYGYGIRVVPIGAADIAWDGLRSVFYVSTGPTPFFPNAPNQVVTLDPATGALSAAAALPSAPGTLAISDDQQFLYVSLWGSAVRLSLPTMATDLTFSLGLDAGGVKLYGGDMRTLPGAPHTLLVARSRDPFPQQSSGLVVYDDGVARGAPLGADTMPPFVSTLEFGASAQELYGGTFTQPNKDVYTLAIGAAGATLTADVTGVGAGRLHYAAGLLYTDDGKVFDPATSMVVGGYPGNAFVTGVLPAPQDGRVFAVANATGANPNVQMFNTGFVSLVASVPLALEFENITRLVRFGPHGLALVGDGGYVILIQGPFVAP